MSTQRVVVGFHKDGTASVAINGEKIDGISSVVIEADVHSDPKLTLEYNCFEAHVSGEVEVNHFCPLKEDVVKGDEK